MRDRRCAAPTLTIESGTPGDVLMECAGALAAEVLRERFPMESAAAWSSWPARETMAATPSSSPGTFADGGSRVGVSSLRRKRVCRATRGRTCSVADARACPRDDARSLIALAEADRGWRLSTGFRTGPRGEIDELSGASSRY
jgi:hypothetical protein